MYTVFLDALDAHEPAVTGLKLAEAWTLMMALSACDYAFERDRAGVMRLFLWNNLEAASEGMEEPMNDGRDWSLYSSGFPDNALARMDIMRRFIGQELRGVHLLADDRYREGKARAAKIGEKHRREPANDAQPV